MEERQISCTYRCLHGLSSSRGRQWDPSERSRGKKSFGCGAFDHRTEAEEGWVSPTRSGGSAPRLERWWWSEGERDSGGT